MARVPEVRDPRSTKQIKREPRAGRRLPGTRGCPPWSLTTGCGETAIACPGHGRFKWPQTVSRMELTGRTSGS